MLAAGELVETAQADAKAATEQRDAEEKAELLRSMGAEGAATLPPALRTQVRQLEEDQKRRATRAQRDVLDRAMVDLLSLYRDVLVVQLGAGVDLVNVEHERVGPHARRGEHRRADPAADGRGRSGAHPPRRERRAAARGRGDGGGAAPAGVSPRPVVQIG